MDSIAGLREIPEIREARTRIVEATLSTLMGATAIVGVILVVISPAGRLRQFFLCACVVLMSWVVRQLVRRAGYRIAAACFIGMFLALFTGAAWTAGGLLAPAVHAFLVLVILAAQMLGRRAGYLTAGVVAGLAFALAWGQARGVMPPTWVQHTPWSRAWLVVIYAVMVAIFLGQAMRTLEMALAYAGLEIQERRRAEEELQAAQSGLEQKVAARTEELARTVAELESQAEALKAAREAQSRFLALVSHELRTPLTSVRASLGLLTNRPDLPAEARPLAEIAERNSLRLLNLTNELLDLEKAASGQFEVRHEPLDLREPMHQAVAAMGDLAATRGRDLRLQVPPEAVLVLGDGPRLEQVCLNLLANALRHAKGGGAVEVRLELRGPRAWVGVSNPGDPIPESFQERIFHPFHQLESEAGTSGLGLSLSKAILDAHGGTIGYRSTPGGVTFWFELDRDTGSPVP